MSRIHPALTLLVALAAITACSEAGPDPVGPDGLAPAAKGGKGGGGGGSAPVTVDMTGGYEATAQVVSIISNNKRRTELGAGFSTTVPAIEFAFAFSDKIDASACTTDPEDMDAATRQNLLDHLDDGLRSRAFSAVIEKDGAPKTLVKAIYDDDAGQDYQIAVRDASAAQGPTDHYVITGGIVWTVSDGAFLRCPFTGALQLTVTR